jgi:hypothetical protein
MQRAVGQVVLALTLVAASAGAAPQVLGPDDRPIEPTAVVADADAYWVRHGAGLPVLLRPDADENLRYPDLPVARLLVLDGATGRPLSGGWLRWIGTVIPDSLSRVDWTADRGRLDLGCRGGETVELEAAGYRTVALSLEPGERRRAVLLEPNGDLELRLRPAAAGTLRLADRADISLVEPFGSAAASHTINAEGALTVRDLDAVAEYAGVVLVPGRAPIVGQIQGLPRRLELAHEPGHGVTGRVLDRDGQPLAKARVRATGQIEELGGFRYHQQVRTDVEGRFAVTGLLAGDIEIEACAQHHACSTTEVTVTPTTANEAVMLELEPGHDLRLVIQDEVGRPVARATVIETDAHRKHGTNRNGVVRFKGVRPGDEMALEVFGAGLRPWQGRIRTDETETVLRLPVGGVLEWPILTARELGTDDVTATWSRLNAQGREIAEGMASWDRRHRLVRADGLDAGPHRLTVRLPGAATLHSEVVEIGPGDEVLLPAVVPERGAAISGRVLDGDTYQPVPGARVTCEPGSPHQFRKLHRLERLQAALTDADGVFLLEGLDTGRCRAVVRAPGFAAWRRDGVEPDEVGADLGDIELDQGMTVVGRVVDRGDRPQAGVTVEITEDAAYAYFADASVRTDHDGWFRAEALPIGRWAVTARRGEATARADVEGRAGETVTVELRLGGIRLEGEVWIGDRPAAGGHLVLSSDAARGDGIVVMIQTDTDDRRLFGVEQPPVTIAVAGDGRFASDGVSPGVYTASYTPPGNGGSPVGRELVIPQTEVHRCVIRYSDAGLEGSVVDPDGLPVAGAGVFVISPDGRAMADGYSDGDGIFSFVGLDAGPVRVAAVHGEFGEAEPVEIELRAGDRVGPVTLELTPADGAELRLAVRSAGGSLAGAPVYLVGAGTMTGFTDDLGVAGFTGVEAGRYRPCAAAYGGAAGCGPEIELADGDRREVVLELGRGGHIDVLLGPMERSPGLRVLTTDGIDLTSMLMMVSPPLPGPDGVRLGPLKVDDYRITVAMPEGPRQGSITAVEGETAVLDLR